MKLASRCAFLLALLPGACYHGHEASQGINASWRGRSASELQSEWGQPAESQEMGALTRLRYSHTTRHTALPSAQAQLKIGPEGLDAYGEVRGGTTSEHTIDVNAYVDKSGTVQTIEGPSLRWGPSDAANLRWGILFGMHAGLGRLDDTGTPLPSGGGYIGGMLGPRIGMVGSYSLAAGLDSEGGAIGQSWSLGAVWWPQTRISLRAGPAMILAFDPGFANVGLEAGLNASASYALLRSGSFVLDLRADLNAGTSSRFASLGIGVNVN